MAKHRKKAVCKSSAQDMWEQMGGEGECQVATNVHHRRSKATGGSNSERNLSRVPVKAHQEYNRLFRDGHMHPTEMARVLTDKWIDPDWEMVARKRGCPTPEPTQPKHDCTACPNHQLRQLLNPMLKNLAQEAMARAFA